MANETKRPSVYPEIEDETMHQSETKETDMHEWERLSDVGAWCKKCGSIKRFGGAVVSVPWDRKPCPALRTCPFCGEEPTVKRDDDDGVVNIECMSEGCCYVRTSFIEEDEAIRRWNRRADISE